MKRVDIKVLVTLPVVAVLFALLSVAQESGDTKALIRKLTSGNFREREAATKALMMRSDAVEALRQTLSTGSVDAESRKRIEQILDHHALREVNSAADAGRADRFVELLTKLPSDRFDKDAWIAFRQFAERIGKLHEDKGGKPIKLFENVRNPCFLNADRVTEQTKETGDESGKSHFIRTSDFDFDGRRLKGGAPAANSFDRLPMVAVLRSFRGTASRGCVIIAGGSVDLTISPGTFLEGVFIVSGGDVTIQGEELGDGLIIARGKVSINYLRGNGCITNSRIVSGKSVNYDRKRSAANDKETSSKASIISENDSNPLGFIRWSDPPKGKSEPKKK
jgi:hypothetical protein